MSDAPPSGRPGGKLKICLAASGGGHLRQLLDLEPVWSCYDHFFVTEPTALGDSIARDHRTHFVQHYSFGQVRWGQPFKMAASAARNFVQSLRLVLRERPDVVITTGAGAVYWTCLLARRLGATLIMAESFARFEGPSKFGRMVKPIATDVIVQSPALKEQWPEARLFDPFRYLDAPRPPKKSLALVTVGATLPFDRMSEAALELAETGLLGEEVILQTGQGSRIGEGQRGRTRCVAGLDFAEMQAILRDADLVITHGGTGSLITALRQGCRVVAMPRLFRYSEHYDDHQLEITTAFADRGLIELAMEAGDLAPAIERARAREPVLATTDHSAFQAWLDERLAGLAAAKT